MRENFGAESLELITLLIMSYILLVILRSSFFFFFLRASFALCFIVEINKNTRKGNNRERKRKESCVPEERMCIAFIMSDGLSMSMSADICFLSASCLLFCFLLLLLSPYASMTLSGCVQMSKREKQRRHRDPWGG